MSGSLRATDAGGVHWRKGRLLLLSVALGAVSAVAVVRLTYRNAGDSDIRQGLETFSPGGRWSKVREMDGPPVLLGARLVVWEDRQIRGETKLTTLEVGGEYCRLRSADALREHLSPISSPTKAVDVSDLVRMLLQERAGEWGVLLRPAQGRIAERAPGRNGYYTEHDCQKWGIPYEPVGEAGSHGGFVVRRIVMRGRPGDRRAQVVLMKDRIQADGSFSTEVERILEEDGRRFDPRIL